MSEITACIEAIIKQVILSFVATVTLLEVSTKSGAPTVKNSVKSIGA
jgi:multisubunit Na+/H+ antiporter MnhF subunit